MSCFYRGTCSCSQVYTPYCSALANDCQFCGIHSMGACCAIWNGHALFGNSCCAKRLRRSTESTLFKKKSFSKRVAEEEAKDALKNKKKKKRRKNSQDLEIMFKALENFCDPKKCEGCDNDCGKCGHQDGRKVAQKISATSIKSYGSKNSYGSKKPEENQKETNKEKTKADTNKYSSTRESKDKSGTLANSTKPGKYENPITTKANETKEASRGSENEETTKAAPSGTRKAEETKANTEERKQFNEIEICNILTDLLVKKFKAMDYTNNALGSPKKATPNTSPCCSKCICEVCSCLETSPDDSTDFSEVESKIGTAVGALISENLSKSRNVAQRTSAERENDSKKLKTPKETLPIGKSPMAAINPRRAKERAEQRMLVNASTSMSDSKDDVMAMPLKKVSNSSAIDRLISELNQIEEDQAKCCKSHSKGYWSEIDEDLSEPDSKKKKKLKGSKKSRTKDARGSFGSKRSSIESKVHKKSRASSDKASPAKLLSGSCLKNSLNKNTCTSKESPARKLGKPMIEILKYANKLNVGRNSRSSWAESPDRDAKETIAQDLTIRKYNRASQTVSLGESVQEGYDSRSPSRGSILTSQIDEHYSHNVRPPPSTKTRTSDKIPELRASVSSAAQRQSKTADKRQSFTSPDSRKPTSPDNRQSVTSPDSRKPTTSPDSRKPTTSRDSRKPTTSPDNIQSDTSPDNRKSITSDKMESPDRRASIRFPDTTSFDNRQSTSAPVLNSRSSRQYQGCNKDSCTSNECPAKNISSRAVSSRIEPVQEGYDSRSPSRGSTSSSEIQEHASRNAQHPRSSKTKYPTIFSNNKIPSTKSFDKKPSISAPDIRASVSNAPKNQSKTSDERPSVTYSDNRQPTTSPHKRLSKTSDKIENGGKSTSAPDGRKPTKSPDNRQSDTSPDIRKSITSDKRESPDRRPSIRLPDKKQSISSDKNQSTTSSDNRQSTTAPVLNSRSSRQNQGCNKDSCTSKECPAKNRSSRAVSSRIEPVQEGYDSRSPSRGSTSSSEIREHASHNAQHPRSSKTKYPTIFSTNKIPSTKYFDKKPSISAPDIRASVSNAAKNQSKKSDERPSVTYSDNRQPNTSPDKRLSKTSDKIENGGKSTSAPDGRKPTTSSDNRQSDTSPDIRKSITSDQRESPDRRPSIRLPNKNQSTSSSDNRQSTTAPVLNSKSTRQYQGCNKDSCTSKECPAKNRSSRAESSRIEPVQEGYDSRSPSRGSTSSSEIQEHASHNAQHPRSSKTKYPTIFSNNKIPSTKSFDKKPSISAPDIRASVSNAAKKQSKTSDEIVTYSDNRQPKTSPYKRLSKTSDKRENGVKSPSAPDGRKSTTSPDNRQSDTSPDIRKSITSNKYPTIFSTNKIPSTKSSDKRPSISAPDIRASVSNAAKTQSKTSDKRPSVASSDGRKPTTSSDNRQPNTSPDKRLSNTSDKRENGRKSDNRQSVTSPDSRKSITSDKRESLNRSPSIRLPDKNQAISSDKRQSTTSAERRQNDGCSNSCTPKENDAQKFNKPLRAESPDKAPKKSTPEDLPIRKCARASQTEPTIEQFQIDHSAIPRKKENAPIIACCGSETGSSDNMPTVRPPEKSDKKPTRRSSDKKPTVRSPYITPSVRSTDKKLAVRSSDKKTSTRSSTKNQTSTSPDKRNSNKSANKRRSSSPSDEVSGSPRQREYSSIKTCTSKECLMKKSAQVKSSHKETTPKDLTIRKSARSAQTESLDKSVQKDHKSKRTSTASSYLSPVETNASPGHIMRLTDNKTTVRSLEKKRDSDKKPSISSPVERRSSTSPENTYSSSSPTTLSSSPRLEMDLIVHTNASSAKKCDCQCRALSRSKNRAEELKESAEDDASYENHSTEISLQKRTVESQTVSPNESPLTDTDSSNASRKSKTANDCSIPAEDGRAPIFSGNKLCQCDTDETDESSMKPLKPANFNENNPPATSRQSKDKIMRKSWSEKDVSLRAEEMRIASLSANERCVCDFKRTDDTSMPSPLRNPNCACSRLQTEEDPMEAPVFPTNNHAYRTKGNRCACKDERKSGSIFMEGASRNSTRRSSDRSQIENKSEAYSSRKETPSTAHGSPMENEDDTYNCQNNAGCQCIYKAPNSREISSKPNLFAFINTKTDDPNTTDANAKNLEAETQSAAPSNCCNFSAQRGERRAECHQAWAAFRKLQECFSDFDLEGECFKKLENYAEFRSDIFGSSCRCDQTLKSNSDEKTRNSKAKVPSNPEEKENVKPDFKNKQNNTKKRSQ